MVGGGQFSFPQRRLVEVNVTLFLRINNGKNCCKNFSQKERPFPPPDTGRTLDLIGLMARLRIFNARTRYRHILLLLIHR